MSDQREPPEPPDDTPGDDGRPAGDEPLTDDSIADASATEDAPGDEPVADDSPGSDGDIDTEAVAEEPPLHITELTPPPPPPPFDDPEAAPFGASEPPAGVAAGPPVEAPAPPDPPGEDRPPPAVPVGPGPDPAALADRHGDARRDGWPGAAKATAVVLAVIALAGIAAAIVGFSRASSAEDDASASSREVAEALQRAQDAERELASAQADTSAQLDELAAERDAAIARADERESEAGLLAQALAEQESENERLAADLEESEEARADLEELVGDIEGLFPVSIDPDLAALDIAGPYSVSLTEVSCVGLDMCGSPPQLGASTLSTEGGGLRLVVPDQLNIPLVAVGGALFGVADDQALVPPCGDVPRDPALTMGLFGDSGTLDADGDLALSSLAGSVLIDVPAVGDCPVARVWYRAQLESTG